MTEHAPPAERSPPRAAARRAGSLRVELGRDVDAPSRARAAVGAWCPGLEGGQERLETLMLLVSEVVTNAVIHSPAPASALILLTAAMSERRVRITVTDQGAGFTPRALRPPNADRITIGGYGLYVVDQAASDWGVDREGGTRVWFEL